MLITILGPDGTGKTTLAKRLGDELGNLHYVYFGNNPESRKYRYFKKFLSRERKGKFNTLLRYIFIFINDYHYHRLARKQHIVSDRCPIDKYVGTKINKDKARHMYHAVALKILPKPHRVILLEGDPEVIYRRKEEIPVSVITESVKLYKEYLERHNISYVSIETVKNVLEQTFDLAKEEVIQLIGEK